MTPEDTAVLNRDDPIVMRLAENVKAKKIFFSLKEKAEGRRFFDRPRTSAQARGRRRGLFSGQRSFEGDP